MKRTDTVALDQDFEYVGEIVKSYVDEKTGKRVIVGAATGVEEDQDGERMSKRAIANMVNVVNKGGIKVVAGTHDQNWLTEIGDGVHAEVDLKTDQLMVKTELPPEGADPIADKAWAETHKRKMGWSVGGKLRAAYHEITDTGKKRKVLDLVDLRHLCLTDKPAYQHSFAHAVAKTWAGDEPADDAFVEEEVAKDVTGSWVPGGGGNSGQDSETGGKRNAGTKTPGSKGMSVEDDGKDKDEPEDDDNEDPVEPAERHLSCPQCGHEFAADIPVDMTPEERQAQDKRKIELEDSVPGDGSGSGSKNDGESSEDKPADNNQQDDDEDDDNPSKSTKKSKEATMDLEKRIEELEARLAKQASDAKQQDATDVAKSKKVSDAVLKMATDEGVDPGVLKIVAVATGDIAEDLEKTRTESKEGFELIAKALMELRETVGKLPAGRKSVARVLKNGKEDGAETTLEKELEDAEEVADVLKVLNRETYGIQ